MLVCLIFGAMQGKAFSLLPVASSVERRAEIDGIDAEIEELKEKKRGFEGRALRAEDQAERMQFEDRYRLETRQYFKIAEENRRKAEMTQNEIDRLEKRKAELLGS